jgi:capsular exopolysaccharide synthesis family protein
MADRSPSSLLRRLVDPSSTSAEPFRTLRLALQLRGQHRNTLVAADLLGSGRLDDADQYFARADGPATLLVTSAEPAAGKSTLAANYASISARGGERVLLVDAVVRDPAQHAIFGASRSPGLVEFAASRTPLADLVQTVSVPHELDLLTAGRDVARASDVAHSPRIAELLAEAAEEYDVVIVDAPPVLATAAADAFAAYAGVQIIFVVDRASRRRNVVKALRRLELVNAGIAGLVLNRDGPAPAAY